jgi:hypothetical protein
MQFGTKFSPIKTLFAKRRLLFKKKKELTGVVLPLVFAGALFLATLSPAFKPLPSNNVSEVSGIFETNDFQVDFASNFVKSPVISMEDFENTGAFQDQENMNL